MYIYIQTLSTTDPHYLQSDMHLSAGLEAGGMPLDRRCYQETNQRNHREDYGSEKGKVQEKAGAAVGWEAWKWQG